MTSLRLADGSTSVQEQEQEAIETVLDETKRAIMKTVSEAKREIPRYTEAMLDYKRKPYKQLRK